jgi:hypothetical protein
MSPSRGSDHALGLIQRRLHLHQALLRIGDPRRADAKPVSWAIRSPRDLSAATFFIPFIPTRLRRRALRQRLEIAHQLVAKSSASICARIASRTAYSASSTAPNAKSIASSA